LRYTVRRPVRLSHSGLRRGRQAQVSFTPMSPGSSRALATAFIVALVVSVAVRLTAQNQDQTPAARFTALMADGMKAYSEQRLDAATASFRAMVDLATGQHDDLWKTRGLRGLGRI